MRRQNSYQSKRRLQQHIAELTSLTKNLAPEAEIVDILIPGYEELDAWIDIVVPDAKEEKISEALSQRRYEIFSTDNLFIGLGITERSQYETRLAQEKITA